MKLLVTGATGYIGSRLVQQALSRGHDVIAASRKPPNAPVPWIKYDLLSSSEICRSAPIDSILHLAAVTFPRHSTADQELAAAKRLLKTANQINAKFIFISSQTAREDAPTHYGITKWRIEKLVLAADACVIRPGQVYGGPEAGQFGEIVKLTRRLPMIPMFVPAPCIQPIHVDDLVTALLNCAESSKIQTGVFCIAAENPVAFTRFLQMVARIRVRRYRMPIPLPVLLLTIGKVILGQRISTKTGLNRLTSLFQLPAMETAKDLQHLGVSPRSLASGMTRSGDDRRRNLIRESQALLRYILRAKPSYSLMRRYAHYVECVRDGLPIDIPALVFRVPLATVLLEKSSILPPPLHAEFVYRLDVAVGIAEASIQGSERFIRGGKAAGLHTSLFNMTYAVVLELGWRVLIVVATPLLKSMLRSSKPPQ